MIRRISASALLLATTLLHPAHAGSPVTDLDLIVLPDSDRETLVEDLETLRSTLIRHKHELMQEVADRKPDGRDALITALMPGGLLYAGIRQARFEQARDALDAVSAEITGLSDDLQELQHLSMPVAVAGLP